MKKLSKFLCALLVLTLVVGMAPAVSASAAPSIVVAASAAEIKAGDTLDVTVSLANNPGIACMLIRVDYDSDAFELTKVTDAKVITGGMHSDDLTLDPYTLFWFNGTIMKDITVNGVVATLTFKALSDAESGDYEFDVSYDNSNAEIINWMLETVDFEVVSASVTLEGAAPDSGSTETEAPETEAPETDAPETEAPETDKKNDKDDDDEDDRHSGKNDNKKDDEDEKPEIIVPVVPVDPAVPETTDAPVAPVEPEVPATDDKPALKSEAELAAWQNPFSDVAAEQWYHTAVRFVNANGIMNGLSDDIFAPDGDVTRAMFVTMLYRIEKEPSAAASAFSDIQVGGWYEKAVGWASANGIVNGVGASEFAPSALITREQMAAIIYRYASYKNKDTSASAELNHSDVSALADYATAPMSWAVGSGLITGTSQDTLSPKANATRAQAATILMRMLEAWNS